MSDVRDKARFKESLETLVKRFAENRGNLREHETRSDIINDMLTGLGWTLGARGRDMWEEVAVKGETTLFLDYLGKDPRSETPLLIVEAKAEGKPVVSLSASSVAGLGEKTANDDDATIVARAVDHLKNGGDVASSPVSREWAQWIEKLRDYISIVHARSGHRVKRVAITSGRWLVIFCDPVLAFLEPGHAADSGIHCFREGDLVQQSDAIYGWLARSALAREPPERLRPAQLRAYVAGDHIAEIFRALWVVHGKVGAHFDERPQITVYPALLIQRYDGLLITVMDDRAGGFILPYANHRLAEHISDVTVYADTLPQTVAAELGVAFVPGGIEKFRGFGGAFAQLPALTVRPSISQAGRTLLKPAPSHANEFLLVTGISPHYLDVRPTIANCRFHDWSACHELGQHRGANPVGSRSIAPRSFFSQTKSIIARTVRCMIGVMRDVTLTPSRNFSAAAGAHFRRYVGVVTRIAGFRVAPEGTFAWGDAADPPWHSGTLVTPAR